MLIVRMEKPENYLLMLRELSCVSRTSESFYSKTEFLCSRSSDTIRRILKAAIDAVFLTPPGMTLH